MNLSMDMLRWLTVRAIRGRTWVGDRVFDSPATPADIRTATEREPFISVYVDDADWTDDQNGAGIHDLYPGSANLVIEVGVASPQNIGPDGQVIADGAPGGNTVTMLNATDEGLEAQIGFISRQAIDALLSTSETNPWAELWRELTVGQVRSVMIRRGGPGGGEENRPKPRYASRVTILKVGTLGEPMRGEDLARFPFWSKALDVMAADEEFSGMAELIRAHIIRPSGALPEWRLAQKYLGITEAGARALGIAPPAGIEDSSSIEEPPLLEEVEAAPPTDEPGSPEVVAGRAGRLE